MHHVYIGGPIGKIEEMSVEVNGSITNFERGVIYESRVLEVIDAVRAGEIEGEVYGDGEVWANPQSLARYVAQQVPT